MKPKLKWLYYLSKLNGLTSFEINSQHEIVEKTKRSFYHFLIFGFFIQGLTILAYRTLYQFFSRVHYDEVRILVLKAEHTVQLFKTFMIFFSNLFYHNDITKLINEIILFKKVIVNIAPSQAFFDDILVSQYIVRSVAFLVQVVIMSSSFLLLIYDAKNIAINLSLTVTIYNHFISLIVSSIFFYGGLVTSSRLLRILNNHFEFCVSSTINKNVDGSSILTESAIFNLEQFRIFFKIFGSITDKLFRIYGLQILITLVASAAFTLSSVRNILFKKTIYWKTKFLSYTTYSKPCINNQILLKISK